MVPVPRSHESAARHRLPVALAFLGALALPFMTGCERGEHLATGTFQVTVTPQDTDETPEGMTLGHSILTKELQGDLEGSAEGAMLTALTPEEGSAGYVAIELVRGTLNGRSGTFLLQHHGLMDQGVQNLSITVIPGSGTGQLQGIRGTMTLDLTEAERGYELRYTLPGGE